MRSAIGPKTWWIAFASLVLGGLGVAAVLRAQGFETAARWFFLAANVVVDGWVLYGLFRFRQNVWVKRVTALLLGTLAAALVAQLCLALGSQNWALATGGIWAMAVAFFAGLYLVRASLSPGWAVTGVARTLLDEAVRMRVPLVFLVLLMLIVPALPFVLDPAEQLRYRIQSFLFWSLTATGVLLSLMTLFLAVGTITSEIHGRQIFLTMTKPVGRAHYLLGKLVGIMALNLLLVAVAGAAIYLFTILLARQPANSADDAVAVYEQVLTARNAIDPGPGSETNLGAMFNDRLERLRAAEPAVYGPPGSPQDALAAGTRASIQQQVITEWYSLPPLATRSYRFTGLERAKELGPTVQLRFKPRAGGSTPDGFVYLAMRINGRYYDQQGVRKLAEGQFHVIDLPSQYIEDGAMEVEIANVPRPNGQPQSSISFNPGDGLQLLYKVGGFEGNFVRALAILWVRLGFLAMLGLAAGTYLGFPVACLLALLVYFTAIGSGYLGESLQSYSAFPRQDAGLWDRIVFFPATFIQKVGEGAVWDAIKIVIRLIGSGFMLLVPSFGEYNGAPLLSDGRYVSLGLVGRSMLWVGLVWTGTLGFLAWLIFRYRELARVTV